MRIAEYGCGVRGRSQNIGKILGLTIAEFIPHSAFLPRLPNSFRNPHSAFPISST